MCETAADYLRYGVIIADYKTKRFVIAKLDSQEDPLVFLRERKIKDGFKYEIYTVFKKPFKRQQAEEIFECLRRRDSRHARSLLRHSLCTDNPLITTWNMTQLDDWIPDEWYDAWKEMETDICIDADFPGYRECELKPEDDGWYVWGIIE